MSDSFAEMMREGARAGIVPLRPLALQESALAVDTALLEVITADGIITCVRHSPAGEALAWPAVLPVFLGGALGGLSGPAGGLYHRAARQLGGLRLNYRKPGRMDDCVMDVLLVHSLVARRGVDRIVLVGHSFGGAVAIGAGALLGDATAGVIALSTQVPGTEHVDKLAGRPLLLVHGDADGVLPDLCSHNVYDRAAEPKDLLILQGEGHLLEGASEVLLEQVVGFVGAARGPA